MNLVIRPYIRGQDEQVRIDIYNRAHAEDEDFFPSKIEDVLRYDRSPEEPHRRRFIAELDGTPVGLAFGNVDPHRAELKGFLAGPHVVPEHRRKGVGTALARRVFEDLRERGMKQVETEERDLPPATGLLESLGFKPVRVFSEMRRTLDALPPVQAAPAGVDIGLVDPTPDVLDAVIAVENEAFKEHFNHRDFTLAELEFLVRAANEEGTVSHLILARVGGTPVGYLWYGYSPDLVAHLKKNRGGLWDLGVLKRFRCRGIASYMMTTAMAHLKREGMDEVELRVDDTNVTHARRLYERLGFTLAYRNLVHRKDL